MNAYFAVKVFHVACAAISGAGFILRGIWLWRDSPMLGRRWPRIVPHVNDTLLLAAAVALCVMSGQYPFERPWLTAKLLGLIAYIGLGSVALGSFGLRFGKPVRVASWLAALVVFGYIAAVAVTKNPRGLFTWA